MAEEPENDPPRASEDGASPSQYIDFSQEYGQKGLVVMPVQAAEPIDITQAVEGLPAAAEPTASSTSSPPPKPQE